jgi:hypothetical protein
MMTQNNDWEGQFMKQCTMFETGCSFTPEVRVLVKNYQIIIDFIQTLLDQTKQDTVKEVIEMVREERIQAHIANNRCDHNALFHVENKLDQLRSEYGIKDEISKKA